MPFKKDPNELGCAWEKTGTKGPYMTGKLEIEGIEYPIVLFKNGNKKSPKAPDWRILRAQPKSDSVEY